MEMIVPILLGVILLASFFVAYLSSQTWPIYQTVLVAFIVIIAVVFFYLGARTLATHKAWGEKVAQLQNEIRTQEQQRLELVGGDQGPTGQMVTGEIPKLKQQLEVLVANRGGALYDIPVEGVKDGVATVTMSAPEHGLVPNSVVFVFDQTPLAEGGRYLGEFKVSGVTEKSPAVQLTPNLPLTPAQAQRLATAKGPWTLYSTMPTDDAKMFADLDEPTRQALLPAESLAEYAKADRPLRDYETFFHDDYVQQSLLNDTIAKITSNIQRTEAAVEETQREIAYRDTEKGNLQSDLSNFQRELKAIAAYEKTLTAKLAELRTSLKDTYLKDRQMAAELTTNQFRAAEEINERTATAAAAP